MNLFGGQSKKHEGEVTKEKKIELNAVQNNAANEQVEEAEKLENISHMKSGSYVIHIHVQKAKRLQLDEDDTCDPYVKICILEQEKQTQNKKDVSRQQQVTYDEHLFIEFNHLDSEVVEEATIKLVAENKGFFKGDLIGQFECSLNKIYNMKNHCMLNQMIALNNPSGADFTKITGYIAVSVQVLGPGDEAVELKLASDKQLDIHKPLIPTQIKKQYKQIYLRFFTAAHLPAMDYNLLGAGSIDAYLKVTYNGVTQKTASVKMENERVTWNVEMLIPVEIPLREDKIKIQLWDWDPVVDEFVCSMDIPVKSILKYTQEDVNDSGNTKMKWINFYGPPNDTSGQHTNKMRRDPMHASHWAGRVLCQYFAVDNKYPTFKVRPIKKNADCLKKANIFQRNQKYFIIGEAGQGICLPDSKEYGLKFKLGTFEHKVACKVTGRNYVRWNDRFSMEFETDFRQLKYFPTLFVYLMDGDKEICFYRESVLSFTTQADKTPPALEAAYSWYQFEPDLAIGAVTDPMQAGMFSMRLYIHDITSDGVFDPKVQPQWKQKPAMRLTAFRMRAAIYQCESLPPADKEGTSDPYIEVQSTQKDQQVRTITCEDTNNPIFYQVKEFIMEFSKSDLRAAMPIVLNVWDSDKGLFDEDDMIGRAIIRIDDAIAKGVIEEKEDKIPMPRWFPVKKHLNDYHDEVMGASVLCSFQMQELDFNYAFQPHEIELDDTELKLPGTGVPYPMPNLSIVEFKCEIIVLGLRELVSTGILPINKAYVNFNLKSLLPASKAKAVQNIQTQPRDKGPNPNMRTILQFDVQMPTEQEFCPRMTCDAYDMVFAGVAQPHIGTFTLDMGKSYHDEIKRQKSLINDLTSLEEKMKQLYNEIQGKKAINEEVDVAQMIHSMNMVKLVRGRAQILDDNAKAQGRQVIQSLKSKGLKLPPSTGLKKKATKVGAQGNDGSMVDFEAVDIQVNSKNAPIQRNQDISVDIELSRIQAADDKEAEVSKLKALFGNQMRKMVELAYKAQVEEAKNTLDKERIEAQKILNKSRGDAKGNLVKPVYKMDKRLEMEVEHSEPPDSLFMKVGFDPKPNAGKKHYRRYYPDELEKITDKDGQLLVESPFIRRQIYRAKAAKKDNFLASLFQMDDGGGDMQTVEVGYFKGIVYVYKEEEDDQNSFKIKEKLKKILNYVEQIHEITFEGKKTRVKDLVAHLEGNEEKAVNVAETEAQLDNLKRVLMETGITGVGIHKVACDAIFENQLISRLNSVEKCQVRVYMMSGFNMAKRDMFSKSDPYLILKCGKKVYNEVENYQLDTDDPDFYKSFDFIVDFPGAPDLEIECWDYDGFFGDELIGKSRLDLDDRYYSLSWQSLTDKPIEYRDMYHNSSTVTQGVVKMWVEINQKDSPKAQAPAMDIQPEPVRKFEMRVVVWKTKEIPNMDVEGCSDIMCKAFIDEDNPAWTDTHWRCQNGAGSFNYRCIMPFDSTTKDVRLTVQAWDQDIVKSNDLIGGCTLNLNAMMSDVLVTNTKKVMHEKYFDEYLSHKMKQAGCDAASQITFEEKDRFWMPVLKENADGVVENNGAILVTVHIVPEGEADKFPQGKARQEPNSDPHCPEPEGRIKLTLNPIEMLRQIIPAKMYRCIACSLCAIFCVYLCIMALPSIIANLITR